MDPNPDADNDILNITQLNIASPDIPKVSSPNKCHRLYLDMVITLLLFLLSLLSFSYINIVNIFICLLLTLCFLDISFSYIITIKRYVTLLAVFLNFIYFLIATFFFIAKFTNGGTSFSNVKKHFLIDDNNVPFTIFNYVIDIVEVMIFGIYYKCGKWDKDEWFKKEYKISFSILTKAKKVKSHLLSLGLYLICLGASFMPTTVNCVFLLIVLIHFATLIFNKDLHRYCKTYIAIIFCYLIPCFIIVNYMINMPGCYQFFANNESLPIYGLILLYKNPLAYEDKNYLMYKLDLLHIIPIILFLFGFGMINIYLKCKDLPNSRDSVKHDTLYDNDIDKAIVAFLTEAKNLSFFNKIKLFIYKYFYSPSFLLHFCRFGMIIWINTYITYLSYLVIVWLLISMIASDKVFFVKVTKCALLPLIILSFSISYVCNIEGINIEWSHIGMEKYTTQSDIFNNMALKITIITVLQGYIHVTMKYNDNVLQKGVNLQRDQQVENEIENASKSTYALTSIEILFKVVFFVNDIFLMLFLYLSISQSINIFNEIMLLFIVSLFIFANVIDKCYFFILIVMNLVFQMKYIVFFIYPNRTKEEYNNNIYNLFSLIFYDELKNPYYYWIAYYFLYINYINQTSKLFKICKSKTVSIYEIIEHKLHFHSNLKFILNTMCDFIFGIYLWLLIPCVVFCLMLQDNNVIFFIELLIVFVIYYKYIKITSNGYKDLCNIYFYTWMMIFSSIIVLCIIYIAQFLNKKPFSLWYALTSTRTKKNLELVGLFIFSGEYGYNFFAYIATFIISVALHCEITRQVKLNKGETHSSSNVSLNSQSGAVQKENTKTFIKKSSYIKKVYTLLYYILHYYWIVIFIVVAVLSIHWMLSISMAIELILFSYYIMKSFMGYYNIMNSSIDKKKLSNLLLVYKKEKKRHFKITSENQKDYYNLIWKFTFTFITMTYLSCIVLKFFDNEKPIRIISAIAYFLGLYSVSGSGGTLNFMYYSWGYFVIIGLFSFRAYFMSKFKELIIREKKIKKKEKKRNKKKNNKKFAPLFSVEDIISNHSNYNENLIINNENDLKKDKNDDSSDSDSDDDDNQDILNEVNIDKIGVDDDIVLPQTRPRKNSMDNTRASIYLNSEESFPNIFDNNLNTSMMTITTDLNTTMTFNRTSSIYGESRQIPNDNQNRSHDDSSISYRTTKKKKYLSYSLNLQIGIKRFIEVVILVLVLISATIKSNIISFFLLLCVILTYRRRVMSTKIMFNISLGVLSMFIIQYSIFVSNISYDSNPFVDNEIISYIEDVIYLPWYRHIFGFKWGTFLSCGVVRYQVNALWIDVVILIILYFYLEFFSFSIYEIDDSDDMKKSFQKFNYKFCNSNTLTLEQYHTFARAMKISYNINLIPVKNIDIELNSSMISDSNSSKASASSEIKFDKKKNRKLTAYKYIRSYFYLSFHYFALILILLIASLNKGMLSFAYMTFSIFYIYKTHSFLQGKCWTFERGIRYFLKPFLFLDLLCQFIFQIPFDIFRINGNNFKIYLEIFGFVNIVDYSSKTKFISSSGLISILLKVGMYFIVLIQEIVYNSFDFKKFILKYHLDYMQKAYIKGKLHSFLFNNYRIKLMRDRMNERNEINETLKKIEGMIVKWNDKLTNKESTISTINNGRRGSISIKMNKGVKKSERLTATKILKKYWFIGMALAIYEESRCISNSKIRDEKEIMDILKGKIVMDSELDRLIAKYEKENGKELEKYRGIKKEKEKKNDEEFMIKESEEENKEEEKSIENNNSNPENTITNTNEDTNIIKAPECEPTKQLEINTDLISNENTPESSEVTPVTPQDITYLPRHSSILSKRRSITNEKNETEENFFTSCDYYDLKSKIRSEFFNNYCSKTKILLFILNSLSTFLIENFEYMCYFFMILNHFMNGNLISIVWVIMVFIFGITQYPRPEQLYWKLCLIYCCFVIFVKFFFQLTIWEHISIFKSLYENSYTSWSFRIGIKKCSDDSLEFFGYIIYDFILLSLLLTNQFMLIRKGLWGMTEIDYETIEEANDRILRFNSDEYKNRKGDDGRELSNEEIVHLFGKPKNNSEMTFRRRFQDFYYKNFTYVRNEKPGKDFYLYYTLIQTIILIYIIFFYTKMDQDKLVYNVDSFTLKQFSGNMVIFALFHLVLIVFDRFIYLKNSRKLKKLAFKVYDVHSGEDITNEFEKDSYESANNKIKNNSDYAMVCYQYEGTQVGLICKFCVQIVTVIGIHFYLFWYFPIQGNINLQNVDDKNNNEFLSNPFMIIFYLLYIVYFIFSGMQIKYGLADMRKKSSLMKGSNLFYSCVFKSFKAIPFLFELKNFIDWTFTTTSFDIFKWLKYEEINALLYINKCFAKSYMGRRVGSKTLPIIKVFLGGFSFFGMLAVVFVPLILFSTLNPSNMPNDILGAKMVVDLVITDKKDNDTHDIMNFTLFTSSNSKFNELNSTYYSTYYKNDSYAKVYDFNQIQNVSIIGYSENTWDISPKGFRYIIEMIQKQNKSSMENPTLNETLVDFELIIKFSFSRTHDTTSNSGYIGTQHYSMSLSSLKNLFNMNEQGVTPSLSTLVSKSIQFTYIPTIKVPSDSSPTALQLTHSEITTWNLSLIVEDENNYRYLYWELTDPSTSKSGINFITFSDLYSSATAGYDILTFYVTFILVVGQYIRSMLLGEAERVIYTEMVNPNKLLNVCEGIRISRIKKDFLQEDKLYYLLIDLMRSPEIVKSITKSSLIYVQKGNIIQEDYRNKEYDVESIVLKEKFNDNHRKAFEY